MQLQEETILNFAVREGMRLPSIHYQACKPRNKAELVLFLHNVHLIMASGILQQQLLLLAGGITQELRITPGICGVENTDLTRTRAHQGTVTHFILLLGWESYLKLPCFHSRTFRSKTQMNQLTKMAT